MVRQVHLIAVVGVFLMGCAVLLLVVGASGVQAETSQKKQGHNEATKEGQARSSGEESVKHRCGGTRTIVRDGEGYLTNDVPGCPKGGPLSDTGSICRCTLDGMKGDDEIHGRRYKYGDELYGGSGSDVIYGGPGADFLYGYGTGNNYTDPGRESDRDVFYGGDDDDYLYGGEGADVLNGGDGNDYIVAAALNADYGANKQRDKLYCGAGRDTYYAATNDYVSSSCEEGTLVDTGGPPLLLLAGVALLSGLMLILYVIRRDS
ncbi:MAG TPA: calcium-binding protein [Rubrobacter sp.]|nr:calcium-binding protein [Rubrobacter sp.]